MTAPLTLIVEGKPLVFDVPVPVGEVIPAGTAFVWTCPDGGWISHSNAAEPVNVTDDGTWFTARPPVAPESFADGDVAWVRVERASDFGQGDDIWRDPDGSAIWVDANMRHFLADCTAYLTPSPRPESLADVLDNANLPDELRARIEKAVGA